LALGYLGLNGRRRSIHFLASFTHHIGALHLEISMMAILTTRYYGALKKTLYRDIIISGDRLWHYPFVRISG
jgi:hypothetical protein